MRDTAGTFQGKPPTARASLLPSKMPPPSRAAPDWHMPQLGSGLTRCPWGRGALDAHQMPSLAWVVCGGSNPAPPDLKSTTLYLQQPDKIAIHDLATRGRRRARWAAMSATVKSFATCPRPMPSLARAWAEKLHAGKGTGLVGSHSTDEIPAREGAGIPDDREVKICRCVWGGVKSSTDGCIWLRFCPPLPPELGDPWGPKRDH